MVASCHTFNYGSRCISAWGSLQCLIKYLNDNEFLFVTLSSAFINYASSIVQWIESEKMRLSHLRDRASETGRRKEYPFKDSTLFVN
jgi:hypothetical protein